jgi:putative ABC transport system permease protein
MYFPFESNPSGQIALFVRTRTEPALAADGVRSALRAIEPSTAILNTRTLSEIASESIRVTQLVLWLLGVFAALALALAAVGIYGVMAYTVRQRTREIGTRMAVGATRLDILWLVMRQGALVGGLGIGAGLLVGMVATRSLRSVLYGVSAADPLTMLISTAVLALTTILACYIPARRASAVDPARTLSQA